MRKITTLIALILASVIAVQAQSQLKRVTIKSKILGAKKLTRFICPMDTKKRAKDIPFCTFSTEQTARTNRGVAMGAESNLELPMKRSLQGVPKR